MGRLALVTLVIPDYDMAKAFFVDGLGWTCLTDEDQGGGKRWLTVAPGDGGAALLLARATTGAQIAAIGAQTGGRVGFFWTTDDFDSDAARITAAGGTLLETPRDEPYGRVAQWRDPWGNLWDLLTPS